MQEVVGREAAKSEWWTMERSGWWVESSESTLELRVAEQQQQSERRATTLEMGERVVGLGNGRGILGEPAGPGR
jgi:hypothetical protein